MWANSSCLSNRGEFVFGAYERGERGKLFSNFPTVGRRASENSPLGCFNELLILNLHTLIRLRVFNLTKRLGLFAKGSSFKVIKRTVDAVFDDWALFYGFRVTFSIGTLNVTRKLSHFFSDLRPFSETCSGPPASRCSRIME